MPYAENYSQFRQYLNTGVNAQYLIPGFIHKLIPIPKDKNFTQSECQSMFATLLALISNNADSLRAYPIGNFTGMEDKSSKATINTTPVGTYVFIKDGKYHIEFTYTKGGIQLHNKLRRMFHGAQDLFDVLIVDKDTNCIMGTKPALNALNYTTKGYTLDLIYVEQYDFNNANDEAKFKIGFVFADVDEFNERVSIVQVPETQPLMTLNGLKDLEFVTFPQPYQPLTAGVAKVRITTGGGATELYDLYAAQLVALTANFTFRDASNNALTCAVSLDAATKTLVFTFSGASFTALTTGAIISCYSPSISQMTATIPGFANGYFELTK